MEMELRKGRPEEEAGRLEKEIRVYDFLDGLGIEYDRIDHAPATVDAPELKSAIEETLGAQICNNLFLANRQRTRFYLLMLPGRQAVQEQRYLEAGGQFQASFCGAGIHGGPDRLRARFRQCDGVDQ